MNLPPFDIVILGQGLAGTALAWYAHWTGLRIAIIDRDEAITSSKISAGLMTPITGKRLTTSPDWQQQWEFAQDFYRHVEQQTGAKSFHKTTMVRTLKTADECDFFAKRMESDIFAPLVQSPPQPALDPSVFQPSSGSFEMREGGQLHVAQYLAASKQFFQREQTYRTADIDLSKDIVLREDGVALPRCHLHATRLVFCQGYAGVSNPWFDTLQFNPARGEMLTVRIPGLSENRVIHGGLWLAPLGNERFRVGATYDWTRFDNVPTPEGREELEARLREWLRVPFIVEEHHAAVRPILQTPQPYCGLHPQWPQLGVINGLASKGALLAPSVAGEFLRLIDADGSLKQTIQLRRREELVRTVPLTKIAHRKCNAQKADIVIDATAGNGHDTVFLAERVGPYGKVYAFDIQQAALDQTAARLAEAQLTNVRLICMDHAQMLSVVEPRHHGRISTVMFNLGYLPRGNKAIITHSASTVTAIRAAMELLRDGGAITILAYPGHPGGDAELAAVEQLVDEIQPEFLVDRYAGNSCNRASPVLLVLTKCSAVCDNLEPPSISPPLP